MKSRTIFTQRRMQGTFLILAIISLCLLFAGAVKADEFPVAAYSGKDVYIIGNVEHVFIMKTGLEGASDASYQSADPSVVEILSTSAWNENGVPLAIILGKKAGKTSITVTVTGGFGARNVVIPIHVVKYENPFSSIKIGSTDLTAKLNGNVTAYYAGARGSQKLSYSLKSGWSAEVSWGYWENENWAKHVLGNGQTINLTEIYEKTRQSTQLGRIDFVATQNSTGLSVEGRIMISDQDRAVPALADLPGAPASSGSSNQTSNKKGKKTVLSSANTTVSVKQSFAYTGKKITPSVTVKCNGKKLKKGTDYTVSYSNNKKPGTATVKVKGKGKYTGSVSATFTIKGEKGKIYSLVIGAECGPFDKIMGMSGDNDSQMLYEVLKNNKLDQYKVKKTVRKKYRNSPSQKEIIKLIKSTFKDATKNDICFFTYSGHGTGYEDANKNVHGTGINNFSYDSLINTLHKNCKGHIIMIISSCFSGGFTEDVKRKGHCSDKFTVISGSGQNETMGNVQGSKDFIDTKVGYLAYYVYMGLTSMDADLNHDGAVTAGELSTYTAERIQTLHKLHPNNWVPDPERKIFQ